MTEIYSKLLDAWKKEVKFNDLQALPEGFYAEMVGYVSQLREQTRMIDKTSLKGRISVK